MSLEATQSELDESLPYIVRPLPPRRKPTTGPRDWVLVATPAASKDILSLVAHISGLSTTALRAPDRRYHVVHWRMIAAYVIRKHRPVSLPFIGKILGGRDHTTIIHSIRKVEANPEQFSADIERVEALL